ncbi:RsmB/NOP family class I SAM-dependent RNA methyltransferase [Oceanobacter mangrovi]|uniref:RsmB/NOP family class I SAM-dependent RNA methyltransferase n=1 Tax=Oceanobacter mangrovi TaxID=2862510 RepID=UPI001C8E4D95|nr:RsmB/NOP family class I SAM-dependent RNA methyltransferase [Oceanobacter mangrovi]
MSQALITYSDLITVWQEWLDAPANTALDRWLKLRAKANKRLQGRYRMALDNAMMDALRYMQLADALEKSFQDPDFDDWPGWDRQWQPDQPRLAAPQHFWFWIQLRTQSEWRSGDIVQQKARESHFAAFSQQLEAADSNSLLMLWHGLRPGFEKSLWQRAELSGWSDEQVRHWVEQQSQRPPLWLRACGESSLETLHQQLSDEGVRSRLIKVTEQQPPLLAALGGTDVTRSQAWSKGELEVQDAASQLICQLVDAQPGNKIWDACAGAGGKTLTLSAMLGKKGSVTATDLHQYKLDELKRRAKRAAALNIRNFVWDGEAELRLPKEIAQQQGFDRILVDAPCTNAGTWRRNPDARWKLTPANTRELAALQLKLLTLSSAALRQNGKLVYATCSWQVAENEAVIEAFLQQQPGFELVSQTILGAPLLDSDTMFCAVLQRKS